MTYNKERASRMQNMSEGALIKRVEDGTLSSAAAAYELRRRGVNYHRKSVYSLARKNE